MEEGALAGGFGAAVIESLSDQDLLKSRDQRLVGPASP